MSGGPARVAAALAALVLAAVPLAAPPPARAADLPGTPVEGAADPGSAPPLRTGLYLLQAPGAGETRWFRVARDATGGRVWYGATVDLPRGSDSGFEVGAVRADDRERSCGSQGYLIPTVLQVVPMTDARTTDAGPCRDADEVLLGITQRGDVPPGTQVQLTVWVEPAITNLTDFTRARVPAWSTPAAGSEAAEAVTPGLVFTDAPTLETYRSYSVTVDPDVPAYVRIPLRFGQHAQVRARPGWSLAGGYVESRWVSPLGGDTGSPLSIPGHSSTLVTDRRSWTAAWVSPTIDPLARQRDDEVPAAVPGDWFLVFTGHAVPAGYGLTLDVRVITDVTSPVPEYAATPAPVPSLAGDATPALADAEPGVVTAPAEPRSWMAPVALGAGAVSCAVAGAILLSWARRARVTPPAR